MKLHSVIALSGLLGLFACSSGDPSSGAGSISYPDRPPKIGKADAWNAKNDPKKFADFLNKELSYEMTGLPTEGKAKITPWAETYWPTYKDSTNDRWQGKDELSPLEKYDVAFNDWTADAAFMSLRPFNASNCTAEWDQEYYDKLGPAAKYQSEYHGNKKSRDGVDSDGDGEIDECGDNDGVESWWGLCHAWTPASMNEPEPLYTIEYNGVTFTPSDIKALLITIYDRSRSIIVGGRCNTKEVERDENGRIKDDNCRDTNAGSFHVLLTNLLGRYGMPFAEDRTYDYQVWNQPIYDFKVNSMTEVDAAKANELLGVSGTEYTYNTDAKRFWEVDTTVRYVSESSPSKEPTSPHIENHLRTDKYHYIVEADADGNIIGGEWIASGASGTWGYSAQPDFLWVSLGPAGNITSNPYVEYDKVKKLAELAQLDPTAAPPPAGSCTGKCDSSEAQTAVDGTSCYCDEVCFSYGDCCDGRAESCGGAPAGSCQGHCGQTDAAPGATPPDLCYCDAGCALRGNCCADYAEHCSSN